MRSASALPSYVKAGQCLFPLETFPSYSKYLPFLIEVNIVVIPGVSSKSHSCTSFAMVSGLNDLFPQHCTQQCTIAFRFIFSHLVGVSEMLPNQLQHGCKPWILNGQWQNPNNFLYKCIFCSLVFTALKHVSGKNYVVVFLRAK